MTVPDETVWALDPHTAAKHEILRRYLEAWFPILSSYRQQIVYIDGFCGPGRYEGGEPGSPLIALEVARSHRSALAGKLVFWFIDERQDRIDHVRDGTYPEIKKATFGQYLQHWQSTHLIPEKFKPSTYNGYRSIVEYHLLPAFREYQMQAITAAEINAFTTRLLQANDLEHKRARSGRTTKNILNLLGKIFAKAVSESYLKISPMPGVDRPRINKEQKGRALKPDEIQSILKAAGTKFHPMFATAVATGMRQGEQFGLDWEHIDFANSVIKVRRELYWKFGKYHDKKEGGPTYVFIPPKSKASVRDIDMSPELRKELLELYMKSGKTGLVFCTSKGTPLNPANIVKRDFRKALESAEFERAKNELPGIGKVRWHDLRHTFGSLKIDQGENIYYVMRQMGHSSIQVTIDIYGHQLESRNPQAAAKTDAMIFG